MPPFVSRLPVLAGGLLLTTLAHAAAPDALHARADALALGDTPYWRLLLRYGQADTESGWRSEARSAHFFLAADGRDNPRGELHALIDALYLPGPLPEKEAAACRFPARAQWLATRLGATLPATPCPALAEWKTAINPAQATLVFASDYLNNPSLMFGHTFLRLDAPDQTEDTRLLAYAVNYAANANTSNPFAFAWKGLTGGYPGVFSLMPYYDKVKEYSDLENRDLWEYQLAFTPAELQTLLDHLWELRGVEFPYFFLTRNCSFQLLSLFEVARPGLALRDAFPVQAIPSDTVRRVLAEPGLFRKVVYRAAAERRLLQDARDNAPGVNRAARRLADDPAAPTALPPADEAAALEAAYDYRYYQFVAGDQDADARSDLRQLLVRRAALDVPAQRTPPAPPAVDPAGGHPTARIALAAGNARDAAYLALRLRPAYHDLLDPPGGYRPGAHIDFLDTELRVDDARQTLRLERLAVVDIDSLANWDVFFRPWSWFFGFGYRQAAVDGAGRFATDTSHGVAFLDGGAGASAGSARASCYALLAAAIEAGPALDDGWRAGAGPRLGCLVNVAHGRLRLQADSRHFDDTGRLETRGLLEGQLDLGARDGLRLQFGILGAGGQRQGQVEAGWVRYF
ncbi:MAG TPA: DUF4105 domain-containing protein [Moraxellaceae bacterium]|nr:DUF4105 domain-containing protein [Moraxellaceae bacterium]